MNNQTRQGTASMPCKELRFLYRTLPGRVLLKVASSTALAKLSAAFLNSSLSRGLIKRFIRKNNIDVSRYEDRKYRSYNDYFTRKQKDGITSWSHDPHLFSSPCDSRVSVYEINEDSVFYIKDSFYKITDLLQDEALAKRYCGGYCFIFRLCVDDYHRYSYVDDGETNDIRRIRGVLHTVQPIATERYNIYKENTREITLQNSLHFGTLAYVEVGAMLIGKIRNHHPHAHQAKRGEEKGYFEYGGSTVVILVEKDKLSPDADLLQNTADNLETLVRLGERVGYTQSI